MCEFDPRPARRRRIDPSLPRPILVRRWPAMSAWFARTLIFVFASGLLASPASADETFLDDVIVMGSTCVGVDCPTDGTMDFQYDTIRMMENNLRIMFDDTSGPESTFPKLDWKIIINDRTNGGEEFFGITAPADAAPVFRIGGGAPSDSLRVEPDGDLSVGGALDVAGDIELSGTVDGRDIAADGIVLDALANATGPNLTSIQTDISALQTGLGTAQGDIGTLQTDLGTAQGDIGTLQTDLGTAQGDIGTLQTDLGTAQGNIGTLQTDLGTAQGDIGTLQTGLGTAQGDIGTLDTSVGDAESDVGTLQTNLVALQGLVGTVQGDVASHLGDTDNPHGVTAEQAGVADRRAAGGTGSAGPWVGILRANEFATSRGQPWVAQVVFESPVTGPYVVSLTNVTKNTRQTLRSGVSGKSADGFTVSVIRTGFGALEEINWVVIPLS